MKHSTVLAFSMAHLGETPATDRTATGRGWFSIDAPAASSPSSSASFADAGYQEPRAARAAASTGRWVFEIVKRNELHKFVVLPKRWIVERTLGPRSAAIAAWYAISSATPAPSLPSSGWP